MNRQNVYCPKPLKLKGQAVTAGVGVRMQEEMKSYGYSHDVDENKGAKNIGPGSSHDVAENK